MITYNTLIADTLFALSETSIDTEIILPTGEITYAHQQEGFFAPGHQIRALVNNESRKK